MNALNENFKQGMWRLAIVCGFLGSVIGCYFAYLKLKPIAHQRELHQRFEQLSNSDVVRGEHKKLQPIDYAAIAKKYGGLVENVPDGLTAYPIQHPPSEFTSGEIRVINWTSDYGVNSIQLEDAQVLYPTPLPTAAWYLLAPIYLVVGFLAPWVLVRSIEWVITGFSTVAKAP